MYLATGWLIVIKPHAIMAKVFVMECPIATVPLNK